MGLGSSAGSLDPLKQVRRQQAEAHLLRAATIEHLAAGLAHELNQPLTAIANDVEACATYVRSRQRGSRLGMGLAISRSIVETHGGRLSVGPRASGAGTAVQLALLLDSAPGTGERST